MPENEKLGKDEFISPKSRYYGEFSPGNLVFNYNLQEFASQINHICSLETGGKLTGDEAYRQIKAIWKELKKSKKMLDIDSPVRNDESQE